MEREVTEKKWFCDICNRQGSINSTCELCSKEYCYICEFIGFNPLRINICKNHQEDDGLKEAILEFEDSYSALKKKIIDKLKEYLVLKKL